LQLSPSLTPALILSLPPSLPRSLPHLWLSLSRVVYPSLVFFLSLMLFHISVSMSHLPSLVSLVSLSHTHRQTNTFRNCIHLCQSVIISFAFLDFLYLFFGKEQQRSAPRLSCLYLTSLFYSPNAQI
jgi:hypothetical protein